MRVTARLKPFKGEDFTLPRQSEATEGKSMGKSAAVNGIGNGVIKTVEETSRRSFNKYFCR
jgi:hypothetical protein